MDNHLEKLAGIKSGISRYLKNTPDVLDTLLKMPCEILPEIEEIANLIFNSMGADAWLNGSEIGYRDFKETAIEVLEEFRESRNA